jgi:hypothetical protein
MAAVSLETRRRLNDHRRLTFGGDANRRVAFVCECVSDDCTTAVLMTHAEYDLTRARKEPVLQASHPSVDE